MCSLLQRASHRAAAQRKDIIVRLLAAYRKDHKDVLHPLRLAAGVLFENGEVKITAQSKALEYGMLLPRIVREVCQSGRAT